MSRVLWTAAVCKAAVARVSGYLSAALMVLRRLLHDDLLLARGGGWRLSSVVDDHSIIRQVTGLSLGDWLLSHYGGLLLDRSGLRLRCSIHLGRSLHSEDLHGSHRYHPGHDGLRLEHCKGFAQGVASNGTTRAE